MACLTYPVGAYENQPNNPIYLNKIGILYYQSNEYQEAENILQKCLALRVSYVFAKVEQASCANWLALIYTQKESGKYKLEKAIKMQLISIELDPANPIYIYNMASIYYRDTQEYQKAALFLKQCIDAESINTFTNVERANCANHLSTIYYQGFLGGVDINAAIENSLCAYNLNPHEMLYVYNLAILYSEVGNITQAGFFLRQCEENISGNLNYEMQMDCWVKLQALEL